MLDEGGYRFKNPGEQIPMNLQQQTTQQQQIVKRQHRYQESTKQYVEAPCDHREFPKWKYHASKGAVLVHNRDEEKRLGPEWGDKPVAEKVERPITDPARGERG